MGNSTNAMIQAGPQGQRDPLPASQASPQLQIQPQRPADMAAVQTATPIVHQNAFNQRPDIKQQNYNANMNKLHSASNRRQQLGRQQSNEPRQQAVPYPSIAQPAQQASPISMPAQPTAQSTLAQQTQPSVGADQNQDALKRQGLQYLIG